MFHVGVDMDPVHNTTAMRGMKASSVSQTELFFVNVKLQCGRTAAGEVVCLSGQGFRVGYGSHCSFPEGPGDASWG